MKDAGVPTTDAGPLTKDARTPAAGAGDPLQDDLPALLAASEQSLQSGRCIDGAALARRAIELADEAGDRPRQAAALCLLARQLTRTGEFEQTVRACEQAAVILRDLDDQVGLCEILIVQALALNELNLSQEALDVLAIGREVATRLQDSGLLYWVLNRIAVVHSGLQDYARAHEFQIRALALSEGMDDDARFCIVNNFSDNAIGLSRQLREEGRDAEADEVLASGIAHADNAIELAITTGNPYRQALSLDNGGMLLGLAGAYAGALVRLRKAREIAAERGYHSLEVGAAHHISSILLLQGRAAEAIPQLEALLERARELGEPPLQQEVLVDLSAALEATGQFEAALATYKELVSLERQGRSRVAETRGRLSVQLADLDIARLSAADARKESDLLRDRSRRLEREKGELETLAAHLDRRANEDALTRLSNRHHLETELPRVFKETAELGLELAVAVLDIDHFKSVNDSFGHALGDAVLVQVAALLNHGGRSGDLVGRMGGEEFLMAFPGLGESAAVEVCERLRRAVQGHDWEALRPGLRVTISLGVCARTDEADVYDVVERADSRMYRAKRAGRNRVEWFSGLESAS
jgi:diguanylate cyclase (GGDEF)-like protein